MAPAPRPWHGCVMASGARLLAGTILTLGALAAPALGAVDSTSIVLTPGPGTLMIGDPVVTVVGDMTKISLGEMSILDATGTGAGWSLIAETHIDGVGRVSSASATDAGQVSLVVPATTQEALVTVTAAPGL